MIAGGIGVAPCQIIPYLACRPREVPHASANDSPHFQGTFSYSSGRREADVALLDPRKPCPQFVANIHEGFDKNNHLLSIILLLAFCCLLSCVVSPEIPEDIWALQTHNSLRESGVWSMMAGLTRALSAASAGIGG